MNVFAEDYATLYDKIHSNKNYLKESKLLLKFVESNIGKKAKILDFGCGTGGHLSQISKLMNFDCFGYDISMPMITIAKRNYPNLQFKSDLKTMPKNFDLVYSLFDVVNYQSGNGALQEFLARSTSLVKRGGVFVLDSWNLPGVKLDNPQDRTRVIDFGGVSISRNVQASTEDNWTNTVLKIRMLKVLTGEMLTEETHVMRAFTTEELRLELSNLRFSDFVFVDANDWKSPITESTWRFVLKAVKK